LNHYFFGHQSWNGLSSSQNSYDVMEKRIAENKNTVLGFISGAWNLYEGCCVIDGKWWMGGSGTYKTTDVLPKN
jgi:hypothetical protein